MLQGPARGVAIGAAADGPAADRATGPGGSEEEEVPGLRSGTPGGCDGAAVADGPARMEEMMGGDETDEMFLRTMLPHHRMAIDMSAEALEQGRAPRAQGARPEDHRGAVGRDGADARVRRGDRGDTDR